MNFTLEAGQGLGNAIKAFAMGDQVRQKAHLEAQGKSAQMYAHNMQGNKYGADAALLANKLGLQQDPTRSAMIENGVPLDKRGAVDQYINSGNFGPGYDAPADGVGPTQPAPVSPDQMSLIARAIGLANRTNMTGSNVQQMANARDTEQTGRDRQAVMQDPAAALRTAQAYFATSGKAPFDNVGTSGYSANNLTGQQIEGNTALAKLFGQVEGALVKQRNASAGASVAQAGASNAMTNLRNEQTARTIAGLMKPDTILNDNDEPVLAAFPTQGGKPTVLGKTEKKGTGEDATNAKTRNAVIAAVEREFVGASDAEIQAEVAKRLERRSIDKSPAPAPTGSKIVAKDALASARDAIARGADRDKVIQRLKQNGLDPTGL